MLITAKIIQDSLYASHRITTFELEYPRFIHSELMTHRRFSRNAASSRAIPVPKMIELVIKQDVRPIWTMNQAGMQGKFAHEADLQDYNANWNLARDSALQNADMLHQMGVHKQNINRLLEPFQMIKVVVTATEFENFFALRCHKDAQPEIQVLAELMEKEYRAHTPEKLNHHEWHVPYVQRIRSTVNGEMQYIADDKYIDAATATKISASCCAQVSYRLLDQTIEKALKIYDMLVTGKPVHASPFEHQATPFDEITHSKGMTRNFDGWAQHRSFIKGETYEAHAVPQLT